MKRELRSVRRVGGEKPVREVRMGISGGYSDREQTVWQRMNRGEACEGMDGGGYRSGALAKFDLGVSRVVGQLQLCEERKSELAAMSRDGYNTSIKKKHAISAANLTE